MSTVLLCANATYLGGEISNLLNIGSIAHHVHTDRRPEQLIGALIAIQADLLIYNPGLAYDRKDEEVLMALAADTTTIPTLFVTMQVQPWERFLRAKNIAGHTVDPLAHRGDPGQFFDIAIKTAREKHES